MLKKYISRMRVRKNTVTEGGDIAKKVKGKDILSKPVRVVLIAALSAILAGLVSKQVLGVDVAAEVQEVLEAIINAL